MPTVKSFRIKDTSAALDFVSNTASPLSQARLTAIPRQLTAPWIWTTKESARQNICYREIALFTAYSHDAKNTTQTPEIIK